MYDTEARRQAVALRAEHERRLAAARDARLTEQHRLRRLAAAHLDASAKLAELRAQHSAQVDAERLRLQRALFSGSADPGELRQAIATVEPRITTAAEAAASLRRAQRLGDNVGALAVFNIASERGWRDVSESYLAAHQGANGFHTELVAFEAAAQDNSERLFSPLKPPSLPAELVRYRDHLPELAAQVGGPPSANPATGI